jgi:hypothetical protein
MAGPANAGQAFFYIRQADGVWANVKTFEASDRAKDDRFAAAMALDPGATMAMVGATYTDEAELTEAECARQSQGNEAYCSDMGALYVYTTGCPDFAMEHSNRDGKDRDNSDCHFRKTATEYDRKPGMKWLRCTAK